MRKLTPEECEFIAGGEQIMNSYYDEPEPIVVTGSPPPYYPPPFYPPPWYPPGVGPSPPTYPPGGGGGWPTTPPPPPPDENSNDVKFNGDESTLTAEQKAAIEEFEQEVAKVDAWISNLPDNAVLRLSDGSEVTGAEVKEAWAKLDFTINPAGTTYLNGTQVGEANWNAGDPVVSFNIDYLTSQSNVAGAELGWMIGHELGHLVSDQRAQLDILVQGGMTADEMRQHQQMANDIAYALAQYNGTTLDTTRYDYTNPNPTFQMPTPPPSPPPPIDDDLPGYPPPWAWPPGTNIP